MGCRKLIKDGSNATMYKAGKGSVEKNCHNWELWQFRTADLSLPGVSVLNVPVVGLSTYFLFAATISTCA